MHKALTMKKLTIKQEKFALKLFETGNATEAFKLSYNAEKMKDTTIVVKASVLANQDNISIRVKELQQQQQKRVEVKADDLVHKLSDMITYDPIEIFNDNASVKKLSDVPKHLRCLMTGISRKETQGKFGTSVSIEYKLPDKTKAIELMMKQLGMFVEKKEVNHTGHITMLPAKDKDN